ncbi:hypothetical protein GWN42_10260 [candidate division KSB1 bacterium]|nr:hypothetical protein [candidate division KSB1 bacterium]
MVPYVVLVYGILVAIGGVMGYAKAKSRPSLIMGSVFGLLILVSSWLLFGGNKMGWNLAFILSVFLTLFFAYRFKVSRKFMPAGLMVVLSLITVVVLFLKP